ncbi:MAG TPA: CBS domain-containing protein [Candidatus Saccharimonadales bacterium]|nr:CBS domain-containing protein [Candidatus Saccharimonadales bacterium]
MSNVHDPTHRFRVDEVMTAEVATVSTSTPLKEAVRIMNSKRISAVPVIGVDGTLAGILSESDFMSKRVNAEVVGELMSSPVATASADDLVPIAARTLLARNVKSLPVVDGAGRVVGIVSRGDLLKVFLRWDEEIRNDALASIARSVTAIELGVIDVSVIDGVVTLSGLVDTAREADDAVAATVAVSGVVHVRRDDLRVRADPAP